MENYEFKVICIKNCEEARQEPWPWNTEIPIRIKNGQIFTTSDFFYLNLARLFSSDGDYLGLFERSNFMKLEEYRNFKIEELLD